MSKEILVRHKKAINKAINNVAPGFYTDDFWYGKKLVTDALDKVCKGLDLTWEITYSAYGVWDYENSPHRKTWGFKITDGNNRASYGVIVAAGAGTVDDPMARYDICAYIS